MKQSLTTGFSFGLTSGIITTLGLIVGLESGTHSKVAVIGGILTIAIADAFSDALGMHISQESNDQNNTKTIWEATVTTFLSKFIFAMTFIIPILFLELNYAIIINVVWGFLMLGLFSFYIARKNNKSPFAAIKEHVFIGLLVVLLTSLIGKFVDATFN